MSSNAYRVWSAGGKPYRLCRPAAALQKTLRARGLTVYDYPNDAHLLASTPEDHTPFSATGWPGQSAYGIGHAIDIMPRTETAAGRAENAAIARRLIADRNAGLPAVLWIKYLNWTDEAGICRQERWMPNHTTRSSTDKGHIHVSGRSDCDDDTRADGYDPMGDDDMQADERGWVSNSDKYGWALAALLDPVPGIIADGKPGTVGNALAKALGRIEAKADAALKALGVAQTDIDDIQARIGAAVTDEQVNALADRVAQALAARPDTPLGDADVPTLVAAFKQAVREGTGS